MRKTGIHQKTDKKTLLGTTFLGKHQFWGDFGIPGRSLRKALGRLLGGKFGGAKKVEKNVVSAVASAGDAYPSKEGLGRIPMWARSNTPSLILTDGRADSMCCAQTAARRTSYAACSHA